MSLTNRPCPDCQREGEFDRRTFLKSSAAAVASVTTAGSLSGLLAADVPKKPAETIVKQLYDSLTPEQRKIVCYDWDYVDPKRGLLRTRVSNNWHINDRVINDKAFYTNEQRDIVRAIFEAIYNPEWHARIEKQLKDDAGGYGQSQNIAIFGKPGEGKFEFVMTGRHMTIRCDGNSAEHMAFGGPVFYGHAASGFNEKPGHPGNVYWEQALEANKVYEMLDGKQRKLAEVADSPEESAVGFQGASGKFPGIPVSELTSDQKAVVQATLKKLVEPYRQADQDEVVQCLMKQGGLDKCSLAFYTDDDLGKDRVWDNWRLEGPSFVWYFRGVPHVHVWVHVSDDAAVKLNA